MIGITALLDGKLAARLPASGTVIASSQSLCAGSRNAPQPTRSLVRGEPPVVGGGKIQMHHPDPTRDASCRRRAGHLNVEHRMGRNHLKGRDGDRANAVLAAVGYICPLLLRWLARLFARPLLRALPAPVCLAAT
jgi:hypothetical protein